MSLLEQVIAFSIEKDNGIEQKMNISSSTFEGFLRQQVKKVYDSVKKPYLQQEFEEDRNFSHVAGLKYKHRDRGGRIVFDLHVYVSIKPVFMYSGKEEDWPGRIYLGVNYEHSDFSRYSGGEGKFRTSYSGGEGPFRPSDTLLFVETATLPRLEPLTGLAVQLSEHLLGQRVPFTVDYFRNETIMNNELNDKYGGNSKR